MRPIEQFINYRVTATGRVFSIIGDNLKEVSQSKNKGDKYTVVHLWQGTGNKSKKVRVHRIVAETFIGHCPKGNECNHKDGNKRNNHVENLEWVTHKENMIHAIKLGLRPVTEKFIQNGRKSALKYFLPHALSKRKLSQEQAEEIRQKHSTGERSYRNLAREYEVSHATIKFIILNKTYRKSIEWLEKEGK